MAAPADLANGPVVVTGASGFIGQALVRHLHAHGRSVVAVARRAWPAPAGVRAITVQAYDDGAVLEAACTGAACVIHLAALAHRQGTPAEFAASVRAVEAVIEAARRTHLRRLVHVSSIGVNGNRTGTRPFTEADPPNPLEPYALSKFQAEQAVLAGTAGTSLEYVIVRPPLVYGADAPGNFGRLVRAVRRGWPLPFSSIHNARTFIGIENLADLLGLCASHPAAAGQVFLAGDSDTLSTPELVRYIAEGLGRSAHMVPVPPSWLQVVAAVIGKRHLAESLCASLQLDTTKVRSLLGWRPVLTAAEGVRRAAGTSRPAP